MQNYPFIIPKVFSKIGFCGTKSNRTLKELEIAHLKTNLQPVCAQHQRSQPTRHECSKRQHYYERLIIVSVLCNHFQNTTLCYPSFCTSCGRTHQRIENYRFVAEIYSQRSHTCIHTRCIT